MKYTVKPGDTMYKLAQEFGLPFEDLVVANPQIEDPDLILPGQVLNIPIEETPDVPEYPHEPECPPYTMPDMGGMMPDMDGMMPDTDGMMPDMDGMMPDMGGMTPDMGGMMPNMGAMMPGMGGMMPGMGGMMPGMGGMMPGMGGMMPGMGGMMPGMGGMMHKCPVCIKKGDRGAHIKCIQKRLKELGLYKGSENGKFGSKTYEAVKKLQKVCGMKQTGIVDEWVLRTMGLY